MDPESRDHPNEPVSAGLLLINSSLDLRVVRLAATILATQQRKEEAKFHFQLCRLPFSSRDLRTVPQLFFSWVWCWESTIFSDSYFENERRKNAVHAIQWAIPYESQLFSFSTGLQPDSCNWNLTCLYLGISLAL